MSLAVHHFGIHCGAQEKANAQRPIACTAEPRQLIEGLPPPATVSRIAFDLGDGRRVIVGSSLGGGVDDCEERRRTCLEGEAVCSRLELAVFG